jgi:hypothetical protein
MDGNKRLTPEERELQKKQLVLDELQQRLTTRESELQTALGGLVAFEKKYQEATTLRYAMLDELHYRIAALRAAQQPDQPAEQAAARAAAAMRPFAARKNASKNAPRRAPEPPPLPRPAPPPPINPSEEIKRLYRDVAKALHPDFASDDQERTHRHTFMARANEAYEANDAQRLVEILHEWHSSPESVRGHDASAQLIRTIRAIARCEDRLEKITAHMAKVETHGMFGIKLLADEADKLERDFLHEMTARLDEEIEAAKAYLLKMGGKIPDPSELQPVEEELPEDAFTTPGDAPDSA